MYGIIATWRMALEGISKADSMLKNNESAANSIEEAIKSVENFEYYKSVGYGGLPNEEMEVELDAAFMDGDTLEFGCVGGVKDFANPVSIARSLMHYDANNFLAGQGAEKYASRHGFERKTMLTDRAKIHYHNRIKEITNTELKPYSGHDTVGMVCLDTAGHMTCATSTSGLFMKGCVSYEIVRLMKEGMHPQQACEKAVHDFDLELKRRRGKAGDMSLIAMNNKGEWGCATNIEGFSFVVATEKQAPTVYLVNHDADGKCTFEVASKEWMDNYMALRTAPLVRK